MKVSATRRRTREVMMMIESVNEVWVCGENIFCVWLKCWK